MSFCLSDLRLQGFFGIGGPLLAPQARQDGQRHVRPRNVENSKNIGTGIRGPRRASRREQMKRILSALCSVVVVLGAAAQANAQTDTNTVTYSVSQVSLVDIAGDVTLAVNTGTAGTGLTNATASTTYAITNNFITSGVKITGSLNTAMPTGTALKLAVAAPASGTTSGVKTLTTTAQDLVTGIGAVNQSGVSMDFTLEATVDAGVISSATKTLTLTLVNVS
jgi:hypothetical protein